MNTKWKVRRKEKGKEEWKLYRREREIGKHEGRRIGKEIGDWEYTWGEHCNMHECRVLLPGHRGRGGMGGEA